MLPTLRNASILTPSASCLPPQRGCELADLDPYRCPKCPFNTHLEVDLATHLATHHQDPSHTNPFAASKRYTCKRCNFSSFSILVFANHSVQKRCRRRASTSLKCPLCPYETKRKTHLTEHNMWKHVDPVTVKWYECEHCPFKTKSKCNLKMHILAKHTSTEDVVKWFECDQCPYRAKFKYVLERHVISTHTDPTTSSKWFKCDHCPFKSAQKYNLKGHIMRKHPDRIDFFKCPLCYYKAMNKSRLEKHALEKHPDGVKKVDRRRKHQLYYNILQRKEVELFSCSLVLPYRCLRCGYGTDLKVNLQSHVTTVHQGQCPNPNLRKILKDYTCRNCDFYSFSLLVMARHVVRGCQSSRSTWLNLSVLKCAHCPYETKRKDDLIKHNIWKHVDPIDVRWFDCEHCTFKTRTRGTLNRHMVLQHTSDEQVKWYKCDHCPFTNKNHGHLKRHVLAKHTPDEHVKKWFECGQCNYRAKFKYSLKTHITRRHSIDKVKGEDL